MSWLTSIEQGEANGAVDVVVEPGVKDLGGFRVRRALPALQRPMVGPFIFLDHMGPAVFDPGHGLDVRPHPHIGLATLTYLVEGAIRHRDTLGSVAGIRPGDVNLMSAGRRIAHSERTSPELRSIGGPLHGIQSWLALRLADEDGPPSFHHQDAADLPLMTDTGVALRLILGRGYGARSPVLTNWDAIYGDVHLAAGRAIALPDDHAERAVYLLDGDVIVAGDTFSGGRLLVFRPGDRITLSAATSCRLLVLGGKPIDGPRHLWWNFAHSSKDRIESAKADWRSGKFGVAPGDAQECIPLPV